MHLHVLVVWDGGSTDLNDWRVAGWATSVFWSDEPVVRSGDPAPGRLVTAGTCETLEVACAVGAWLAGKSLAKAREARVPPGFRILSPTEKSSLIKAIQDWVEEGKKHLKEGK